MNNINEAIANEVAEQIASDEKREKRASLSERVNAFNAHASDFVAAELDKSAAAESAYEQTHDVDDKRAMLKAATKAKYVALVAALSDKALRFALRVFSEQALIAVFSDSYSVAKACALFEALAHRNKALITDQRLANFVACYALASASDRYSKYYDAVECIDNRQNQMCIKLFSRLSLISMYSKRDNIVTQNRDHAAYKALSALFDE